MDPTKYQELANRTSANHMAARLRIADISPQYDAIPSQRVSALTNTKLLHSLVGLAGEVGELAEVIEHLMFYGSTDEINLTNIAEEFGDMLWYIALASNALGLNLGDIMEANIAKLKKRYPEKFTLDAALEENRDRDGEANTVSGVINKDTQK